MIEVKDSIKVKYWTSGTYINIYADRLGIGVELYDYKGKAWEVFEDVNGERFWAREVKK